MTCITSHVDDVWTFHVIELLVNARGCVDPIIKVVTCHDVHDDHSSGSSSASNTTTTTTTTSSTRIVSGSPLCEAVRQERFDIVEMLVDSYSANVNENVYGGVTPLMTAAAIGDCRIVKFLLDCGAKMTIDRFGDTAWHVAARHNKANVIEVLIQSKALLNSQAANNSGYTPLHVAVITDSSKVVRVLVDKIQADIWPMGDDTENPLFSAIKHRCSAETIATVLTCKSIGTYLNKPVKGSTPLDIAIRQNFSEGVKLLLKAGVEVNNQANSSNKMPPILEAAMRHNFAIIVVLVLRTEVDALVSGPKSGNGILHFMVHNPSLDCRNTVNILFEKFGSRIIDHVDVKGQTPLFVAASSGCNEMVDLLLTLKANCNHLSKENMTPLHLAACSDSILSVNVAKRLIDANANIEGFCGTNICGGCNESHVSAKHTAVDTSEKMMVDTESRMVVMDEDEDTSTTFINKHTTSNWELKQTPLHLAVSKSRRIPGNRYMVELLLDRKASIHLMDTNGNAALHLAVQHNFIDAINQLASHGADINLQRPVDGATAMHLAVERKGNENIMRTLIRLKADLSIKDNLGQTVLHWAMKNEPTIEKMRLLLVDNKVPNVVDKQGKTALDLAEIAFKEMEEGGSTVDKQMLVSIKSMAVHMLHVMDKQASDPSFIFTPSTDVCCGGCGASVSLDATEEDSISHHNKRAKTSADV